MSAETHLIFDRTLLRARRDRLAMRGADRRSTADFLFHEVGRQLGDRLLDFKRRFALALILNARDGALAQLGIGQLARRVHCDLSSALLSRGPENLRVAANEELLPFGAAAFDLVLSNLGLHWVNDLPGALAQILDALKPDGLFLATLFGAGTLTELRQSLIEAETEIAGGASLRVAPFADLRDAAGLLQRVGFALPVADRATIQVTYQDPLQLLRDLRAMGETSVLADRPRRSAPRLLFQRMASIYRERFGGDDGRVPATFQVLFLAGWAPHGSQQRPARRGSAKVNLGDALG